MGIFTAVKFNFSTLLIGMFLAAVVGYLVGYFLRKVMSQYQIKEAEARKKKILEETEQETQNRFKTAAMEAKEQALIEKIKVEKESVSPTTTIKITNAICPRLPFIIAK